MASFEFSRWDGTQEFSPQSADELFDQLNQYLMDYGDIKALTGPIERQLDHYCLNEIPGLENPTSEMIAKWIWDRLVGELPLLHEIQVQETCTSSCCYRGT